MADRTPARCRSGIRRAARRQRWRAARTATAAIAVATAAILIPLSLVPAGGTAPSTRPLAELAAGHATITIDPQIGEIFTAAPASATPKLTAQQAWARFMRHIGSARTFIPSGVHVQLGLLTLPVGPAAAPGTSH